MVNQIRVSIQDNREDFFTLWLIVKEEEKSILPTTDTGEANAWRNCLYGYLLGLGPDVSFAYPVKNNIL